MDLIGSTNHLHQKDGGSLKLFTNEIQRQLEDENSTLSGNFTAFVKDVLKYFFDRYEQLEIRRKSDVFSETEAAIYLRLPDPECAGKNSIRYYALQSKQLSYVKVGRDGLLFMKSDLESFLNNQKVTSHRDL